MDSFYFQQAFLDIVGHHANVTYENFERMPYANVLHLLPLPVAQLAQITVYLEKVDVLVIIVLSCSIMADAMLPAYNKQCGRCRDT